MTTEQGNTLAAALTHPTPWTFTANSWQYTTIYDANGDAICRLDLEDWGVTENNQDVLEKTQAQIARRIVDAVNATARCVDLDVPDGEDRSTLHADGRTRAGNDISGI